MLDTNICSYIIREKPLYIKKRFIEVETNHTIGLSSIVVSELLYEATKKKSKKLLQIVNVFIDNFVLYDYNKTSAFSYAKIRTQLENQGKVIGTNDLLIAAHTLSLNAILVTNNTREFERIEGLKLENWIK
jgi:tRNA(fMet)-specific endonuclease VapC